MNPKDNVLVAVHEFEQVVKAERLPCLIIVGFPHDQSFVRFSGGMESDQTRGLIKATALRYIGERAKDAGAVQFDGVDLISLERIRQQSDEGWSFGHDDEHDEGELARAAACYAMPDHVRKFPTPNGSFRFNIWPWLDNSWKPTPENRIRELSKAGALIAAEIDRLQRAKAREGSS